LRDTILDEILNILNLSGQSLETYKIQHAHRTKLINFWDIKNGDRIFEVGCGQGDTTVALAHTTGEKGFVYGIDIASPDYGSPETLGQAREKILRSPIGNRIEMHFHFDLLNQQKLPFETNEFDYAVLSHCLWYLSSYEELVKLLETARKFCKKLCIAEWNPVIKISDQIPHYMAVTIQAICESFAPSDFSNVRTLFYPADIKRAVVESGWRIEKSEDVYSDKIQDGTWEISMVKDQYKERINEIASIPQKLKNLLSAQIDELGSVDEIKPMSAFCLIANRNDGG